MIDKLPSYIIIKKVFLIILIPAIFVFLVLYYKNIKTQQNAIVAQLATQFAVNRGIANTFVTLLDAGFSVEEICEYLYTNGGFHKHYEKAQKEKEGRKKE